MKRYLVFVLLALAFFSCKDKEPIAVAQFDLPIPTSGPIIDRSGLVSGSSFAPGYANGKIRSNMISLSWERSTDAGFLAYKVVRNGQLIKTFTDASVVAFTDSFLFPNTYYRYAVATIIPEGTSKADTITLKTPRFTTPSLRFQVLTDTTLRISWSRTAESANAFRLEKRGPADPNFATLATIPDTFYNDRNVVNLNSYSYRITATSPYETTATSSTFSFFVAYNMTQPTLNSLTQVQPTRIVQLSWTDNSSAEDGFRIYRRLSTVGTYELASTVGANTTAYTDADTINKLIGQTYYYYVQGFNARDTTRRSNERIITLSFTPIQSIAWSVRPPTSMTAGTSYPISWLISQTTSLTNVVWFGAASGSTSSQSGPAGTYTSSLTFFSNGTYFIYARAFDNNVGVYRYTDTVVAIVTGATTLLSEGFEGGFIPSSWTTGGNGNWFASSISPYAGSYSARSGTIGHSQSTYLTTSISYFGSRTISFYYRVSSESGLDILRFTINGSTYNTWSGETGWQYYSTTYSGSGTVTLRWEYSKDGSVVSGSDAAWIDNVLVQ